MIPRLRPSTRLLSDSFAKKIIDESYLMLERIGVFVENEEAVNLLRGAGARIDHPSRRAFIPSTVIERALSSAPRSITLFDATGDRSFIVGGDEIHFDPGSSALRLFDHTTQSEREA